MVNGILSPQMVFKVLILAILDTKCIKIAAISAIAKDWQSCFWELESRKLDGKWHFTIKNGLQKPHFGHFRYQV